MTELFDKINPPQWARGVVYILVFVATAAVFGWQLYKGDVDPFTVIAALTSLLAAVNTPINRT